MSEEYVSMNDAVTMRPGSGASLGEIDQYELVRELGGGGFGCVYLARDTVAGIDVAVKGLPPLVRHNKEELENIRRNFALISRLHNRNIAAALTLHPVVKAVYNNKADAEKLRVFAGDTLVVMQYAPGITLSQWRKQFPGGKVPLDKAVEITRQIASALDYAHEEKILHRDIKPANVMIETSVDGKITARVLDFGLAAEFRSSMSRVSAEVTDTSGTRPYMAPEQWLGGRQGAETDQYSLAVLFYELLTGEVPFASVFQTGDPVLMMNVVGREIAEMPTEFSKVIQLALAKALAKKREERFASCMEFVDALEGKIKVKLSSSDVGGAAGSVKGRIVAIAAAVIALMVVGGVAWYWNSLAQENARIAAEEHSAKEAELKAEVEKAKRDAGNAELEVKKAKLEVQKANATAQKAVAEAEQANSQAEKAKREADNAVREADAAIKEKDTTLKESQNKIKAIENAHKTDQAERGADAAAREAELKEAQTKINELQSALNDADAERKKDASRVKALEARIKQLESSSVKRPETPTEPVAKNVEVDKIKLYETLGTIETALKKFKAFEYYDEIKTSYEALEGKYMTVKNATSNGDFDVAQKILGDLSSQKNEIEKQLPLIREYYRQKKNVEKVRQNAVECKAFMYAKNEFEQPEKEFVKALDFARDHEYARAVSILSGLDARFTDAVNVARANSEFVYQKGLEEQKNGRADLAVRRFKEAASKNHPGALTSLGLCYLRGAGISKNEPLAFQSFQKAAYMNHDQAQYFLGGCYAKSIGTRYDKAMSRAWMAVAAVNGNKAAEDFLKKADWSVSAEERRGIREMLKDGRTGVSLPGELKQVVQHIYDFQLKEQSK